MIKINKEDYIQKENNYIEYVEEDYIEEDYVEEDYIEEEYVEEDYIEEDYVEEDYIEDYVEENYIEEDYIEDYVKENYIEEDYIEDYVEEEYVGENYVEEKCVEKDYIEEDYSVTDTNFGTKLPLTKQVLMHDTNVEYLNIEYLDAEYLNVEYLEKKNQEYPVVVKSNFFCDIINKINKIIEEFHSQKQPHNSDLINKIRDFSLNEFAIFIQNCFKSVIITETFFERKNNINNLKHQKYCLPCLSFTPELIPDYCYKILAYHLNEKDDYYNYKIYCLYNDNDNNNILQCSICKKALFIIKNGNIIDHTFDTIKI